MLSTGKRISRYGKMATDARGKGDGATPRAAACSPSPAGRLAPVDG